jgi:methylase of polypeptide subunit release factors
MQHSMANKFQQTLRSIGKACQDKNLTEAEVEKIFQERDFFVELGYRGFGQDILAQRGKFQKRFDVALTGFGGRVHAVIEFKKPAVDTLDAFRDDLLEKYVRPELALFGVLTNGVEMIVYARTNGRFPEQKRFNLSETTEPAAQDISDWLRKPTVHLDSLDSVLERLRYNRSNALIISDPESEAARIFFQVFRLKRESSFGRLTLALKDVLPKTLEVSRFTRGSYDFWLRTYSRELSYKSVPLAWREFLAGKSKTEISHLSFALETAYSIVSRLMLAKAADDRKFPGVRFMPRIQESLNELAVRGRLSAEKHRMIVQRSFERASEVLFSSIFLEDIFDWWMECPEDEGRALFHALGEAALTVSQFDFLELSGDLMGGLYQRYFDRDTRKALGEFYTPGEVIEFILDECGYKGQQGERLLDPACGSGSFLAAALRRYLAKCGPDPKKALQDLTEGLRIVGFDINPFAVLMAQMNYAALILPLYAEAVHADPDFRILRLPVFRTDSLRIEEREEEGEEPSIKGPKFRFGENTLDISIYLPIKGEKERFHRVFVSVPRYQDARDEGLIKNLEEYVAALACVFQSVRDPRRHSLNALLRVRFTEREEKLAGYLEPTANALRATVEELRGKFDDGRFLKTIEDLVLAVSLKHDLRYDYVVGNPPYVRIQKIPEHVKQYWEGKYQWTEHNFDLYVPFLERTVRSVDRDGWLGKGGRLGFILSDRFLNVEYGQKIREELPKSLRVDLIFDFRDTRVFENALNYPAILIAEREDKPTEGDTLAARVFTSEAKFADLVEEFSRLRKRAAVKGEVRGDSLETFALPRKRLAGDGWWPMPPSELKVFSKLQRVPGRPLAELTATSSGGFAGYQTSADNVLVMDQIGGSGETVMVRARHKGDGCENKPIEIEKEALRPFLFGKDVGRWVIDWKRSWVVFPYDRYARAKTMEGGIVEEWNLIPSKKNVNKFKFLDPDKVEVIEDRFPKAWKYLTQHEEALRKRENDRFKVPKAESHLWYGATYPRGLDYYFRPKLVLQLLSRQNSFAYDRDGKFVFQAGGKGGGVYGIAPAESISDLGTLLALLNSRVIDFLVKQTSSVYGGRFYSYADQFLKSLPVAEEIIQAKSERVQHLSKNAVASPNMAGERQALEHKLELFPDSFDKDVSRYELDTVKGLAMSRPSSAQLSIDHEAVQVAETLYGFEVQFGSSSTFSFEFREHAECLARALRERRRKSLPLKEVLAWRLPIKREGARKLLELFEKAREDLTRMRERSASLEEELSDLVYDLYGVSGDERKVIEDFLARFSSSPAGPTPSEEEEDEDLPSAD